MFYAHRFTHSTANSIFSFHLCCLLLSVKFLPCFQFSHAFFDLLNYRLKMPNADTLFSSLFLSCMLPLLSCPSLDFMCLGGDCKFGEGVLLILCNARFL